MSGPILKRHGADRRSRRRRSGIPIRLVLAVITLAFVVVAGAMVLIYKGSTTTATATDYSAPIAAAEHFVQARVGSDHVVNFSPRELTTVEKVNDQGEVKVSGIVEVVRTDGQARSSYSYQCRLQGADRGWNLLQLDMMKQ